MRETNFCCFKPSSLWHFVTVSPGNYLPLQICFSPSLQMIVALVFQLRPKTWQWGRSSLTPFLSSNPSANPVPLPSKYSKKSIISYYFQCYSHPLLPTVLQNPTNSSPCFDRVLLQFIFNRTAGGRL